MATAITLLMMAAIVNLFANLSGSIRNRRAVIELSSTLRQVRQRLARDLAGCTVPVSDGGLMPWRQRPGEAIGYFEILEGEQSDADPSELLEDRDGDGFADGIDVATSIIPGSQLVDPDGPAVTDGRALGDADDILALTVRSLDDPFVANVNGERVESNLAEVIWYAAETPPDDATTPDVDESGGKAGMRTIYRRVMIIAPWLQPLTGDAAGVVSSHRDPVSGNRVANTLADLTRREYRFAHEFDPGRADYDYPHELDMRVVGDSFDPKYAVLNDALALDVRVYDPGAPLFSNAGVVVEPSDPGWEAAIASTPVGFGAYCDLGWNNAGTYVPTANSPQTHFQQERQAGWHPLRPGLYRDDPFTYDTWTWHYENDGRDQDNRDNDNNVTTGVDEGANGIDDNDAHGIDDVMERESSPPYPVPLRGVKVILRTYELAARQVREVSVTHSFVP
ncbi:MAG TPA: hypothetical protein VEQ85_11130 [Lacipirellulaceae bacterium]|nr:hypothetical protein [Lacipirellulaceae bacterium]